MPEDLMTNIVVYYKITNDHTKYGLEVVGLALEPFSKEEQETFWHAPCIFESKSLQQTI